LQQGIIFTIGAGVGFFGSKALTQMFLGANNTGMTGYLVNGLVTAGLSIAAAMFRGVLGRQASIAVASGGILQLIARIITDQTPFGQFTSQLGVGDYQMQNFVTPQRLKDPLGSAEIEIPPGWAPTTVIQSAAVPKQIAASAPALSGYNTGGFSSGLYSSAGLYS
jgi:hypothetical protein